MEEGIILSITFVGFIVVVVITLFTAQWWEDTHCPVTKGKHEWEQWGKKNWCTYECRKCGHHKHSYKDLT